MAKYNRNSGNEWKREELTKLKVMVKQNTPTRVIGLKLGRTPDAIYTKASEERISLKPSNRSPYNRRTKQT